jgi:hypothetical protein
MANCNPCCPVPFRYRRTVVVATNACNPYGFGGVLGGCGVGPYAGPYAGAFGVNAGLGFGLGVGANCGAGAFGWGVNVSPYGPF